MAASAANLSAPGEDDVAPFDAPSMRVDLSGIVKKYPKWTLLPLDECEFLRATNGTLWALLNQYSNLTSGLPVRCLEHAPAPDLSSTVRAAVLAVFFVLSLAGNSLAMHSLLPKVAGGSVHALIFHLCVADLLVTASCLLGEAAWTYSVSWLADNFTCKLFKFVQVFSLYLSTFVLVLIGLDRFAAVRYPMKALARRRLRNRLVGVAWILSLLLSSPQFLIFRVGKGPFYEDFYQCVTYGFYTEAWQEQLYTVSSLILMFVLPLIIIVWSYMATSVALARSGNEFRAEVQSRILSPGPNRRRLMRRARSKSMRISLAIVAAFVICWTPYYFMMFVFVFYEQEDELAKSLRSGIFCFGMTNSLVNPIIYGAFHLWKPHHDRRIARTSCTGRDSRSGEPRAPALARCMPFRKPKCSLACPAEIWTPSKARG